MDHPNWPPDINGAISRPSRLPGVLSAEPFLQDVRAITDLKLRLAGDRLVISPASGIINIADYMITRE